MIKIVIPEDFKIDYKNYILKGCINNKKIKRGLLWKIDKHLASSHSKVKKFLIFLKQNINQLIIGTPSEIRKLVDQVKTDLSWVFNKESLTYKKIFKIFINYGYETLLCNSYFVYKFIKIFSLKVCPFCNRNYITLLSKEETKTGAKVRPHLDHFFPKSKYPFLAVSLYNLIPSCFTCNFLKGSLDPYGTDMKSPYEIGVNDFQFTYIPKKVEGLLSLELMKLEDNLEIDFRRMIVANNNCFQLKTIYNLYHRDIVAELILKRRTYPEIYFFILKKFGVNNEDIYRLILCNYYENFTNRPLHLLIKNIAEELEFLWRNREYGS